MEGGSIVTLASDDHEADLDVQLDGGGVNSPCTARWHQRGELFVKNHFVEQEQVAQNPTLHRNLCLNLIRFNTISAEKDALQKVIVRSLCAQVHSVANQIYEENMSCGY